MKDNGIISLNEHADSLEKVTTVKRVAEYSEILRPNSEIKEVVASKKLRTKQPLWCTLTYQARGLPPR